ncbi:CPBP family intramembrane glutamic endopeptidase [Dysgonomonas sp. GY617]|uniref:CPBP family intramembrane glutamic endopeptidase n=1 Tax=Dysgonomonas sp. GY617 TaxID=2780420 RepID=UPI001884107D|nr:type II CAAX endopeptidase family protein [Dysgonomonas sp. GY617]MBF0577579.1 CPBP family intramembrane metalloprotease [Dysgonomonas sp. GY617]
MKYLIKKYPVLLFSIANLITSIFMVLCFSFSDIPQWSPALYAIIIVIVVKGKTGLLELFKRLYFRKEFVKWNIVALVLPISVCWLSYIMFSYIEYKQIVPFGINHTLQDYCLMLLFVILGSIGEEIGWRGFLLPQLHKTHSLFVSSVIIGLLWGVWHLNIQLVFLVFITYLGLVLMFSFITSWLYEKTNGNIISCIILHSTINICSTLFFEVIVLSDRGLSQEKFQAMFLILLIFFAIPSIFIVKNMLSKSSDTKTSD